METDVLIIGAGPTGLSLAAQLIRFGIDFVIIDKKPSTTPFSKAIGVHARTLEIYEQIDLAADIVQMGWKADKTRLLVDGVVRGEVDLEGIGSGMSPFPFLLIIEQGKHEKLLYDHIRAHGKDVRWNAELVDLKQHRDAVTASLTSASVQETIRAKYLIGCDGAHSLVRHSLGIEFGGSTFERLFYVADVEIEWEFSHDALYVNLGSETLTAFFPMTGERQWRIVGTFPEGHSVNEGEMLFEQIERQVSLDTKLNFDIKHVNWFSVYKVHSRHVNRFSDGRCFLAGDAAHIHTPAGAQGMNTGIQDGYNLAWKLACVLKAGSPSALLDSYNEERLPNARRLLQTTDRLFHLGSSEDAIISFIRTRIFPYVAGLALSFETVRSAIFPLVSQIGINYRESSLSVGVGEFNVAAGDRMPWFEVDGRSIYHDLHSPLFHLIVFTDGNVVIPPLPVDLTARWAGRIDSHVYQLDEKAARIFGSSRSFFLVLRPDNYIGMISNDFSPVSVAKYLERF